ncbi:capsule assembly Wzi family protein [Xylanibacter muris]|uniref:Capsule assembly Wzi family protein n=1 Tax=Xylanibacter muris TaxID=2736290 RepID=A0ABX2AQP1_9BACT|nr:capsule assembly Wzi family protein [Xylanibacter muris]NPD92362.1 hypothetical protein [Xylanibacter muris]
MANRILLHVVVVSVLSASSANADEKDNRQSEQLHYKVEMQGSGTFGDNTPLWLNANKYGLSSLDTENGYIRASLEKPVSAETDKRFDFGGTVDVVAAWNYTSRMIVQQAFLEGRWLKGVLTVGSKHYPMEMKNQELSSGSQTLGINARPVPQVRMSLPEYWALPFTNGWVSLKGHVAFGKTTDDNWQKDFTGKRTKYTQGAYYHSKAGYIKIGNEYRFLPVSLELGLEMAAQFGGKSYNVGADGENYDVVDNGGGFKSFWNALIPGGFESVEGKYQNIAGNQLGSWLIRLNFDYESWYLGLYADHFFEDQSSMFFLDYDGYGQGMEWNEKKRSRYLMYSMKDMMLGAELKLKNAAWINNIVFEYIYTKYQSGPIYHDHTENISDHIGGNDNYYNHYVFTGFQHWGQVMGNPLYLSPLYNDDGMIMVKDNRFWAFHLGFGGAPSYYLKYRVLGTYRKGFGTYSLPYDNPEGSFNMLAEAVYAFPEYTALDGWSIKGAFGVDLGNVYGDNYGLQLTVAKEGIFNIKKNRKK